MTDRTQPRILLIDIDGLRPDAFASSLAGGRLPNIARLLGGPGLPHGVQIPAVAPAPSITFCSQACLVTGVHPREHGIPGNQFFDRFGTFNNGVPRHFAFDVGDTLAVDDAVRVFVDGLATQRLTAPTLYEKLAANGKKSAVVGHMYARGADHWHKPSLAKIARFIKGGNLFGMSSREFDRHILDQALNHLREHGLPDLLMVYFLGIDHESHANGPTAQAEYLAQTLDPLIGELASSVSDHLEEGADLFVALFSDHGQIEAIPDDRHSLRIGFPFDREMGHLFSALGLDVHDFPGEDPNCDAVMALNGGLAHVYLQNRQERWSDLPRFEQEVLPVGRAFWEAHRTGQYAPELKGALAGVLARNVEKEGWGTGYQALSPEGHLLPLESWFDQQPSELYTDPVHRLNNLAGLYAGDLLLISSVTGGVYFGGETAGIHGGLHPGESAVTLVFGWPGRTPEEGERLRRQIATAIQDRCLAEGGRLPSTTDLVTGLAALAPELLA